MVTGTYKSLMLASDLNDDYQASIGLLDRANITLHAGVYGIVNNGINLGKWAGIVDDNTEMWDLAADYQLKGQHNLANAYTDSKAGYDLAGDLVTSLVPGMLAVKAINAMKATKMGLSTVGFFDGRANKLSESIKLAYQTEGQAAKVGDLKFAMFGAKFGQQAVEGTIITAAIEATQNLGDTLNDSGLTGMEKLAKISGSLLVGAVGQGVIGGAWAYKAEAGALASARSQVFNEVEAPFTYRSISSRVGNIPIQIPVGDRITHALGEYDRIAGIPAPTELHVRAQARNLATAKTDIDLLIGDIFPKSDKSDAASAMRNFMRTAAATPEGRKQIVNVMSGFKRVDYTNNDVLAKVNLTHLTDGIELRKTDAATLAQLRESSASDILDTKSMKLQVESGTKVIHTLDDFGDLSNNVELAAHASLFKMPKASRQVLLDELTEYALHRGLTSETTAFDTLKEFYKWGQYGAAKSSSKFAAIKGYMMSLGDDVAESVYGNTRRTFLDLNKGSITDTQIVHLGDTSGFEFLHNAKAVTFGKGRDGTQELITTQNMGAAFEGSDLLKYQAARLISHSDTQPLAQALAKSQQSLEGLSVDNLYRLEALVAAAKPKATSIKVGDREIQISDAVTAIGKMKSQEYERLLKADPTLDADSVYNTLGYTDLKGAASILVGSKNPEVINASEFVSDAKTLMRRKIVTLVHEAPAMNHAQLSAASFAESQRAEQVVTFRALASRLLGRPVSGDKSLSTVWPELQVEAIEGFGDKRLLASAPSIGNYGDLITGAAYVGDNTVKQAEAKFGSILRPGLEDATALLLKASPAEQAEYLAFKTWYAQQSEKFFAVRPNVFVKAEHLKSVISSLGADATADIDKALKGLVKGVDYAMISKDGAAANYIAKFNALNREHIAQPKLDIQAAYGNHDAFDLEALYLPPPSYKFVSFMAEDATSPMSQTSSTVYRIGADSREALEAKVRAALSQNPGWVRKDPADMKEFAQAQGKWEWNGKDLTHAGASSGMHRTGGVPDVTPETDIAKSLADDLAWMKRSNMQIHRSAVELHYSDLISQLNTLSRQAQAEATAELGMRTKKLDDYAQISQTLLGSDEHGFSTWKHLNNSLEDWTSKALTVVNKSIDAVRRNPNKIEAIESQVEEVSKQLEKFGIKMPMADATAERLARELNVDPSSIRSKVSWLNHWQATFLLRLDATDAFVNMLGTATKVGSEFQFLKTRYAQSTSETKAVFDREVSALFGTGSTQASTGELFEYKSMAKAFQEAIAEYHTPTGKANVDRWTNTEHLMSSEQAILRNLHEDIKIDENLGGLAGLDNWRTKGLQALSKAIEFGATPSKYTASLSQYAALHIAERLGKALQLKPAELQMFKFKFSSSVNANYIAAQKPRLFQGAAGIAMSLYQSYMFHTMSNLFRYAEHGTKSAPAMFAALNSTFFGAQSLPGFNFINENIVAKHGNYNTDVYGAAAAALGQSQNRDLADFVMYGAGAFLLQGNMYTRGGLTPRSPILIPSAVEDVPLAQAVMKFGGSIYETASRIVHGAPIASSMWDGLVNLGLNRPLTGVADILRQKSVDGQYSTVMLHDDIWSYASAVRVLGMRPLNEQVGRDFMSRQMAYKANDAEMKKRLGKEIRIMQTHNPAVLDDPEFTQKLALRYQKAGGSPDRFDQFLADQLSKGADDLYDRLEGTIRRNADALSTYRDVFGGYE